jgi:hypothetical protein
MTVKSSGFKKVFVEETGMIHKDNSLQNKGNDICQNNTLVCLPAI